MSAPRPPRPWLRRLGVVLGAIVAMLVLAFVVAWLSLPWLVRRGFESGARTIGSDEAAITVARADFSGLRATNLIFRRGGLGVRLDEGRSSYSLGALLGGRLTSVTLEGLSVTLDFTRPRRGMLPDAVEELLAMIPSSDDPLVWPVDEMIFERCQVVMKFPGGTQAFTIAGKAMRQPDGVVAFTLESEHPEQQVGLSGILRTETMDGELTLDRLSLQPTFPLGLARELGLFELPADTTIRSGRLELSGAATLKAGALDKCTAHLRAEQAGATSGSLEVGLAGLTAELARAADGNLTADICARIEGRDLAQPWSLAPAELHLALDRGTVRAKLARTAVAWGEQVATHVAVDAEAGVPGLGGKAGATVRLDLTEPTIAGVRAASFSLTASGWTDRVTLSTSPLGLAEATPGTMSDLVVTIQDPLGSARAIDIAAKLNAAPALMDLLPAGWRVTEPALPQTAFELRGHVDAGDAGIGASLDLIGAWPKAVMTAPGGRFACTPQVNLTLALAEDRLSLTAAVEAKDIESDLPQFPPGVRALRLGCEALRIPLTALTELAEGRVPKDELAAKVSATVFQSETRGDAYVAVRHFGESSEWAAEIWGMLDNVSGTWGGAAIDGLRAEVTIDTGRLPDAAVGEWLQAPTTEWMPLARHTLPQTKVDVSLTAASVEQPGVGRSEWTGLWLQKERAAPGQHTLDARAKWMTGLLRAGPETLEQPEIDLTIHGTVDDFTVEMAAHAMLEGARLASSASPRVQFDWETLTPSASGWFSLEPITLANSDVVTRWVPAQRGVAVTATVAANGTFSWPKDGAWDGTANLSLSDGTFSVPDQGLRIEGVDTTLVITSLRNLRTEREQPFSFARLALGNVEVTNAVARFSAEGVNRVRVDTLKARVFGGDVSVGSFTLEYPAPDVGTALEFEGVDAGELMRHVDIFKGTVTGKLRGRIPVGLLAGRPYFGEGFLELDRRFPAHFSMDARGLFTTDLPSKTTKDKVVRLPYEVLEEALGDVAVDTMRLDFFRRDAPETPIRIEFSGRSETRRARVPLHIVTRVNGSIPEAMNFLFRLASL
ncbi:MAG: YdbH domain-containing protein [Opitutaceae bacterium]|nr:YdbH domain-containing protein [Opitutaceae bacterium]